MTIAKPLVSILIPVFNAEQYIRQCLDSVVAQTYRNLQIVLIDDGSKDNSLSICNSYAEKDNRLEVYHQENQGVAATRNHLLEKVMGDYILFVDSDDWIEFEMVEYLVKKAIVNNSSMVVCSMVKNNEDFDSTIQNEEVWEQPKAVLEFLRHVRFNGSLWNKLVATSLLHNVSIPCGISYGEDALFMWNVLQKCNRILVTDKVLYHYRMNDSSLSHQSWSPEKKGTGSIVWRTITDETCMFWPQYTNIAQARYAIEDMWGLYFASLANYPYDENIRERQLNIRRSLKQIRRSGLVSMNKIVTCYCLAYCYSLGKLLKYTRK